MPTPWTYPSLAQAVVDYMVLSGSSNNGGWANVNPVTKSGVNTAIANAEDRLAKEIDLPAWRKTDNSFNLTAGSNLFTLPNDFVSMQCFSIGIWETLDDGTQQSYDEPLLQRDASFIREAFPSRSATEWQAPRYYAMQGGLSVIVGATPDQPYAVTLDYTASIGSIINGPTWLGTYAPSALFFCTLEEMYIFTKGETEMLQSVAGKAQEAIQGLSLLGSARLKHDTFKQPTRMVKG